MLLFDPTAEQLQNIIFEHRGVEETHLIQSLINSATNSMHLHK